MRRMKNYEGIYYNRYSMKRYPQYKKSNIRGHSHFTYYVIIEGEGRGWQMITVDYGGVGGGGLPTDYVIN